MTGRNISLGDGPELEVDLGQPEGPLQTPAWQVASMSSPQNKSGDGGNAIFQLTAKEPALSALVTYRWNGKEPVLRKFVQMTNAGEKRSAC